MNHPEVVIKRTAYHPFLTTGLLEVRRPHSWVPEFRCHTMELPWKGNEQNISCIPAGRYRLKKAIHKISTPDPTDDYAVYEIAGVSGRYAIHMHIANWPSQIKGCVALGMKPHPDRWGVAYSKIAFNRFMDVMGDREDGWITIADAIPYDWRS